jgi:hypothetical protein
VSQPAVTTYVTTSEGCDSKNEKDARPRSNFIKKQAVFGRKWDQKSPEAHPALDSGITLVSAAIEALPSLDHADATLESGPPFLAGAEPALLLLAFALGAFDGAIGNAEAFDAFGFGGRLVLGREETSKDLRPAVAGFRSVSRPRRAERTRSSGVSLRIHRSHDPGTPECAAGFAGRMTGAGVGEATMSDAPSCPWCDRPFQTRRDGGKRQVFCRAACRRAFHAAARSWVLGELAAGHIAISDVKNGPLTTRALSGSEISPSPAHEGPLPQPASADGQDCPSDDFGRLIDEMDEILGEPQ